MFHFGAKEINTLILVVLIPYIVCSQKDDSWKTEDNRITLNKDLVRTRLRRNIHHKSVSHHISKKKKSISLSEKRSSKHGSQATSTRTVESNQNKTVNKQPGSTKRNDPHSVDITEYLHGDGVQNYPVPMSNPDPYMDLRHDRASFGPDSHYPIENTENGLTTAKVLDYDASMLASAGGHDIPAGSHDIQLDTGCSESCRLLAEDKIVDGERADAAHLIQQANMLKENSRMMAAQASHLEHEAMILGKPKVGGSVTGYSQHMLDASLNVDKPAHIPSGDGGQGPERGGTLSLEHNALNYGHHHGADDTVQLSTGFPVYHLPTENPEQTNKNVEFVRPLPPVNGPNPYEILTSSQLNKEVPVVPVAHVEHVHHLHPGIDAHLHHGPPIGAVIDHAPVVADGHFPVHYGVDPHTDFRGPAIGAGLGNAHLETDGNLPGHRHMKLVIDLPDLAAQHGKKRSFKKAKRKHKIPKKKN